MQDIFKQPESLNAIIEKCNGGLLCLMPPIEDMRRELRYHGKRLMANRLTHSARFINELMVSLSDVTKLSKAARCFVNSHIDSSKSFTEVWREEDGPGIDELQMARSLYDSRELKRCAHVLKSAEGKPDCQASLFLYNYALYMHGSQRREEEIFEKNKSKQYAGIKVNDSSIVNQQAKNLVRQMERLYQQDQLDDLNTYLYGMMMSDLLRYDDSANAFIKCLNINPCHWGAWQELARLILQDKLTSRESYELLSKIKDHWMKNFFLASLLLEKVKLIEQFDSCCLDILSALLSFYNKSSYLTSQVAQLFYHKKDHDTSILVFQEMLRKDPYRLDNLDIYSNILYVKDNPKDLGALAYNCFNVNKYSAETNCIIGNYHSLMSDHEKAIIYFRQALTLDRTFLAAWTLIGHEYLELKKVANAIDAYNHAVKIDNKDFRAWYGLGQAYELQSLLPTAIHYYLMAVKTRPRDFRMWNALSVVYSKIDKPEEAAKCSERSENYKDDERIALFNLAKIYDSLGLTEKAVACFIENLNRIDSTPTFESVESK
jgi:anaphase-promoting complex subunit 8